MPVIAACKTRRLVHSLLHDRPLTIRRQNERVKIKLKAVGDRIVVDAGREAARSDERITIEAFPVGECTQFIGRSARVSAAAAAEVDTELIGAGVESSF